MDNILSNKGLTSSEANHITNITKELVKDLSVESLTLSKSSVLKENGNKLPLDEHERNDSWVGDIIQVGNLYSLSAWLKTAIKYKENLLNKVDRTPFNHTVEAPKLEKNPELPLTDFNDYLDQLNTKQRNEYFTAEAKASHIGKFVHQFDRVREESENFRPTSFMRVGHSGETATVVSERLYSKQELTDGFFKLQKEHRESEQVVNLYKSRHKEWEKSTLKDYSNETKAIRGRNTEKTIKYNREVEDQRVDFENELKEKKNEISALKIIIPKDLQPVLDYVNDYAKK